LPICRRFPNAGSALASVGSISRGVDPILFSSRRSHSRADGGLSVAIAGLDGLDRGGDLRRRGGEEGGMSRSSPIPPPSASSRRGGERRVSETAEGRSGAPSYSLTLRPRLGRDPCPSCF